MPTLEDADGAPIDVTPTTAETVNARFSEALNADPATDQAPPKRRPRTPAPEAPKRGPGRPRRETQARTVPAAAVPLSDEARESGVLGLAQIPATVLLLAGKTTGNLAYQADAMTIVEYAPAAAAACAQIAKADPAFAARLDRICSGGPYAALVSVGVTVVLQFARNHRPAAQIPGTVHPDQLLNPQGISDDQASPVAA